MHNFLSRLISAPFEASWLQLDFYDLSIFFGGRGGAQARFQISVKTPIIDALSAAQQNAFLKSSKKFQIKICVAVRCCQGRSQ
jgi:hypothetical protein